MPRDKHRRLEKKTQAQTADDGAERRPRKRQIRSDPWGFGKTARAKSRVTAALG